MDDKKLPDRVPKGSPEGGQFKSGNISSMNVNELKEKLQHELQSESVRVIDVGEDSPKFGSQEELDALLGEEFTGYKGQAAVDKLLHEKRGHIKGAFHRDDIGDIDLLWGNEHVGLRHILEQREKQGINGTEFINDLSQVVEKGAYIQKNDRGNFEFIHNGKMAIIAPEYHGNRITFVLTAYKTRKKSTVN